MDRDWKSISKQASEMEPDSLMLLSNPGYDTTLLPEGSVAVSFEEPVVGGEDPPTKKQIRSFFWENRKNRSLLRDRATIWRKGNIYGLGVVTTKQAMERLENGN